MSKKNPLLDADISSSEKANAPAQPVLDLKEYSKSAPFSFDKSNYILLLMGLAVNVLGFILMIGGGTDDPNKFDKNALFSDVRITIGPMLIVIGYVVIGYAIMRRPKSAEEK